MKAVVLLADDSRVSLECTSFDIKDENLSVNLSEGQTRHFAAGTWKFIFHDRPVR